MPVKRYPELIKHYPVPMQIFVKALDNRIRSGKNALAIVVGQTGSGKSLSTVSIMVAYYIYTRGRDPEVDYIAHHCLFRAKDMMRNLNDEVNPPTRGEFWNWDEAGVDISHKTHMSLQNRVIGWLAQTFRNMQQIVFFTVPSISFIDASVRKLLHYYLETRTIIKKDKLCVVKPLLFQYNVRMDKLYYHNLTMPVNKKMLVVDTMNVPIPDQPYLEAYESKKNSFTKDLNLELAEMLQKVEDKDKPKLTDREQSYIDARLKGIDRQEDIALELDITQQSVSQTLNRIRNKIGNVEKYLEKVGLQEVQGVSLPRGLKSQSLPQIIHDK